MRRVWDACEGKAEETFATNLRKAAEAAALRAKEDPATFAEEVSMTAGPDPEIRDARQRAAAWRRPQGRAREGRPGEAAAEAARRGHRQGRENLEPDGREVRGPPREDDGSSAA